MTASIDLSTTYLGFHLPHPFMVGASPLVDDLDTVRRLEDAGSAAIVVHSLIEEQITAGEPDRAGDRDLTAG
jgi:dihydroorotate dehydrogenase (fumarate)